MTTSLNATRNHVPSDLPFAVRTEDYSCGWHGKHQPPYLSEDGALILEIGEGYKSRSHLHFQNFYTLEAAAGMWLIEYRKGGDMYGAGMWHYLIGQDNGHIWIAHVPQTVETIADAVEYLKPAAVKKAEEKGFSIPRQGDWFFIPAIRGPHHNATNVFERDDSAGLDGDHIATEIRSTKTEVTWINRERVTLPAGSIYVRGYITHGQHHTHRLGNGQTNWYKAIRNKAIRTGRLAMGDSAD